MAKPYRPSYRKAVGSWIRYKLTGKGTALRHPIRTTFKAQRHIISRRLRGLPLGKI